MAGREAGPRGSYKLLGAFWLVKVLPDQGLQSQRRWSRKPGCTLSVLAGEGARLAGEPSICQQASVWASGEAGISTRRAEWGMEQTVVQRWLYQ